jgi:signal peptidase I
MQPEKSPENKAEIVSPAPKTTESFWKETLRFALFALLVVLPVRLFVAQPFIVSGASMETSFEDGEYLIIDQLSLRFDELKRGEVVVFKYPEDPSRYYIKRIVGLPGEVVTVNGADIRIGPADGTEPFLLEEPYLASRMTRNDHLAQTLGSDEYFVMGDNRLVSSDSRVWGPLKKELIVGTPLVRLYPLSRIDAFPGLVSKTN